ncbi:hypothetical protein SKAU_G00372020 [Synaphobranchus kaupii]|uniref:G-protein coupled receptors family 1 profile domain-containing protein n=1 Tax=Synaphobranchus kaupii TaxID=118154 RepID=A0A9Q1IG28_SYNKA|nr:hypothetical protein SKAU_G00372020 [Synaphobranchus kaupii]
MTKKETHSAPQAEDQGETMISNTSKNDTDHKNLVFVGTYSLVFVAGLILNVIALVVFCRYTKLRSHTIVYMTNLALADLLLVSTLPVRIYYYLGFSGLSQNLCEGLSLVLLVNMYGSIFLLACMSFDRCMAVCYPMSSRVKEGRKKAPLVCLGVWMLTVGASLPTYLFKKGTEDSQTSCFGSTPIYAIQPGAVFSTLTIGFGIPLATMMTCSWFLIKAISRSTVAQTDVIDSRKIQRMITVSLLIFLVCFLPYHLILGLLYFYRQSTLPPLVTAFQYSLTFACLNAMLDPLAYYFTTETFRNNVDMNAVRKMWPLHSHSSDGNPPHVPLNTSTSIRE